MMSAKRLERGHETFQWDHDVYDISALLRDIEERAVSEMFTSEFSRHGIEIYRAFLEGVQHPDVPSYMTAQHRIKVDLTYASALGPSDLAEPVIALHVGYNAGTIQLIDLEPGYNFVVADGNHRLIRAYQLQVEELPILAIPEHVAKRYRMPPKAIEL